MPQSERADLRATLRRARNALTPAQQQHAAAGIATKLLTLPSICDASALAMYLPNDGEVSLTPFAQQLADRTSSAHIALPVLHPFSQGHLLFLHYHADTVMRANRFGISEPVLDCTAIMPVPGLDVILMPLVGFDRAGNRLGMGGGFYDRTLAHRHRWPSRPALIGIAHDCQQTDNLPVASWDVPLDAIVTPTQIIRPARQ